MFLYSCNAMSIHIRSIWMTTTYIKLIGFNMIHAPHFHINQSTTWLRTLLDRLRHPLSLRSLVPALSGQFQRVEFGQFAPMLGR